MKCLDSLELSEMERFKRKYPEAKALLLGTGGIPLEEFFISEPGEWFA